MDSPSYQRIIGNIAAGRLRLVCIVSPARTTSTTLVKVVAHSTSIAAYVSQPFDLPVLGDPISESEREEIAYAHICAKYDEVVSAASGSTTVIVVKEMCRNLAAPGCFERFAKVVDRFTLLVRNPLLCHASGCRKYPTWFQMHREALEAKLGINLDSVSNAQGFCNWDEVVCYSQAGPDVSRLPWLADDALEQNIHPRQGWTESLRQELLQHPFWEHLCALQCQYNPPVYMEFLAGIASSDKPFMARLLNFWINGWMAAALMWQRLELLPDDRVVVVDGSMLRARPHMIVQALCEHFSIQFSNEMVEDFEAGDEGAGHVEETMKSVWMADTDTHIRPPQERPPTLLQLPLPLRQHFRDVSAKVWFVALSSPRLLLPCSNEEMLDTTINVGGSLLALRSIDPLLEHALASATGLKIDASMASDFKETCDQFDAVVHFGFSKEGPYRMSPPCDAR